MKETILLEQAEAIASRMPSRYDAVRGRRPGRAHPVGARAFVNKGADAGVDGPGDPLACVADSPDTIRALHGRLPQPIQPFTCFIGETPMTGWLKFGSIVAGGASISRAARPPTRQSGTVP